MVQFKITITMETDGKMVIEGLPADYLLGLRMMVAAARLADTNYQKMIKEAIVVTNQMPPKQEIQN